MRRLRGRRVALLLASALPLVAENDDVAATLDTIATTAAEIRPQEHHQLTGASRITQQSAAAIDADEAISIQQQEQEYDHQQAQQHDSSFSSTSSDSRQPLLYEDASSDDTVLPIGASTSANDRRHYPRKRSSSSSSSSKFARSVGFPVDDFLFAGDYVIIPNTHPQQPLGNSQEDDDDDDRIGSSGKDALNASDDCGDECDSDDICCGDDDEKEDDDNRNGQCASNATFPIIPFRPYDCSRRRKCRRPRDGLNQTSQQRDPKARGSEESLDTATSADATDSSPEDEGAVPSDVPATSTQEEGGTPPPAQADIAFAVDYASKSAGGLILESSPNFSGTSHLLTNDRDRYALVPCDEPVKYVVIGLSEDILVKRVVLGAYERYSSHVHKFQLFATSSLTAGAGNTPASSEDASGKQSYVDLGTYEAEPLTQGAQHFDLEVPMWARYLKVQFLSFYEDEHYCTISQIKVHGSTVLQGFHEQWEEEEAEEADGEASSATEDADSVPLEAVQDRTLPSANHCLAPDDNGGLSFESAMDRFYSNKDDGNNASAGLESACSALSSASMRLASSALSDDHKSFRFDAPLRDGKRSQKLGLSVDSQARPPSVANPEWARTSVNNDEESLTSQPLFTQLRHAAATAGIDLKIVDKIPGSSLIQYIKPVGTVDGAEVATALTADGLAALAGRPESEQQLHHGDDDADEEPVDTIAKEEIIWEPEDGTIASAGVDEAVAVSSSSELADLEAEGDPTAGEAISENSMVLSKLLERLPSANCLKDLDFSQFRSDQLKTRTGGQGPAGSSPVGGGVEPIFKKLADEIKALQASVAVHDQFTATSIACYQKVLFDLFVEMESLRSDQESRLGALERELNGGVVHWIVALREVVSPMLSWAVSCFWTLIRLAAVYDFGPYVQRIRLAAAILLSALFGYQLVRGARKPRQSEPAPVSLMPETPAEFTGSHRANKENPITESFASSFTSSASCNPTKLSAAVPKPSTDSVPSLVPDSGSSSPSTEEHTPNENDALTSLSSTVPKPSTDSVPSLVSDSGSPSQPIRSDTGPPIDKYDERVVAAFAP